MKFYAHLRQPIGCDFTVGCGELLVELKATTQSEAIAEARNHFDGVGDEHWNGPEEGDILAVAYVRELPVESWRLSEKISEAANKKTLSQASRRELYDQLKAEFEPGPKPCLDPDKMHGAGDGQGGSDY